jgi:hypothetical protein
VKKEKRKKGYAIAGRLSRGVRPCQMRVAPHSLFLLPTISRMIWSSWLLLIWDSSRGPMRWHGFRSKADCSGRMEG